jgi:hypothetical protein
MTPTRVTLAAVLATGLGMAAGGWWAWRQQAPTGVMAAHRPAAAMPTAAASSAIAPVAPVAPVAARSFAAEAAQASSASYRQAWELSRLLATPTAPKPSVPRIWRIVGITQVGNASQALVLFEGSNVPELKKPSDQLPGGATIVSIHNNSVEVAVGGRRMYITVGQP